MESSLKLRENMIKRSVWLARISLPVVMPPTSAPGLRCNVILQLQMFQTFVSVREWIVANGLCWTASSFFEAGTCFRD